MSRRRRIGKNPAGVNSNPCNYKTIRGLITACRVISEGAMDVRVAMWLQNAKWALQNQWGWSEKDAAMEIARYHPKYSAYRAAS